MLKHPTRHIPASMVAIIAAVQLTCLAAVSSSDEKQVGNLGPGNGQVVIERLAPERVGGNGYRLVYHVDVPIDVYWKFKTDFDNSFLTENKFIREHHFISRYGNIAITENQYTYQPGVFFRWQTRLFPEHFRLSFVLLNPEQCNQKYHHGYIQLEADGIGTRVTQVAYFDFWGATFWAFSPWNGGMQDFLSYTARWEQSTVLRLRDRYNDEKNTKK